VTNDSLVQPSPPPYGSSIANGRTGAWIAKKSQFMMGYEGVLRPPSSVDNRAMLTDVYQAGEALAHEHLKIALAEATKGADHE